jgi:hypothetical protein
LAIAQNPKRNPTAIKEERAESFISGAGRTATEDPAEEDRGRKPVIVRIPADLLKRIDQAAQKKSISRSSFIVSSMADLINGER